MSVRGFMVVAAAFVAAAFPAGAAATAPTVELVLASGYCLTLAEVVVPAGVTTPPGAATFAGADVPI